MMKKLLFFILACLILLNVASFAFAESEFDNSVSYSLSETVSGSLSENNKKDFYDFMLSDASILDINISSDIKYVRLDLYDENGKQIWNTSKSANSTTGEISYQDIFYLNKGTYYLSFSGSNFGEYNFKYLFESANESFEEIYGGIDNKTSSANAVDMNKTYTGFLSYDDNVDIYKINIASSKFDVKLSSSMEVLK